METRPHQKVSDQPSGKRIAWTDYGRALDILVIVFYHSNISTFKSFYSPNLWSINSQLSLVRMPYLFLLSGIYSAHSIFQSDFPTFFNKRIFRFAYLYFVWALLLAACTHFLQPVMGSTDIFASANWNLADIPTGNVTTIWFLYSLVWMALLARLLRRFPWPILLFAFGVVHLYMAADRFEYHFQSTTVRTFRFFEFYLIGIYFSERLKIGWHPRILSVVFWLSCFVVFSKLAIHPHLKYSFASLVASEFSGIMFAMSLSQILAATGGFEIVSNLGSRSLDVFVGHRLIWLLLVVLFSPIASPWPALNILLLCLFSTIGALLLASGMRRIGCGMLYEPPKFLTALWIRLSKWSNSAPTRLQ